MLRKFCCGLIVIGAMMSSVGVVNTAFINSAMAEEKCAKCGHLPSKAEKDCKCECHQAGGKKGY